MILRFFEYGHGLVVGDIVPTTGFGQIVGHVAHPNAPVAIIVCTALIQHLAAIAAGADAHAKMAFITLQPIGNMLNVNALILHSDGFLHGNDMHSDARTTHGHHGRNLLQREKGHALEEHGQLGMTVHKVGVHIRVFGRTRYKHRHPINAVLAIKSTSQNRTLFRVVVAVVILQHPKVSQLVQQFV